MLWLLLSLLLVVFVLLAVGLLSGPIRCPDCNGEGVHIQGEVWRCNRCGDAFGGPDLGD